MISRRRFCRQSSGIALTLPLVNEAFFSQPAFGQVTSKPFVLFIYCHGGWDQSMVFDNKIGTLGLSAESGQAEAKGKGFISYLSHASRPQVSYFFSNYGDKAAILNGVYCGGMGHREAQRFALSVEMAGRKNLHTDWLSLYAYLANPDVVLPHIVFNAPCFSGPLSHLVVNLTAILQSELITSSISGADSIGDSAESSLTSYLGTNYAALTDKPPSGSLDHEKITSFYRGYARQSKMQGELTSALASMTVDSDDTSDSKNAKLALHFFKGGLSQTATLRWGSLLGWDSHKSNYSLQTIRFEDLFLGLNKIVAYAGTLGISDNLTIVVGSELGRYGVINADAGKDHWPYTSVLLWGKGIKGSSVIGKTDERGRGHKIDPTTGAIVSDHAIFVSLANIFSAVCLKAGLTIKPVVGEVPALSACLEG